MSDDDQFNVDGSASYDAYQPDDESSHRRSGSGQTLASIVTFLVVMPGAMVSGLLFMNGDFKQGPKGTKNNTGVFKQMKDGFAERMLANMGVDLGAFRGGESTPGIRGRDNNSGWFDDEPTQENLKTMSTRRSNGLSGFNKSWHDGKKKGRDR